MSARPVSALAAATLATIAVGLALPLGCASPAATEARVCHCDYTTDTDVPGSLDVRVCVPPGGDAVGAAGECAVGMGVGHVERCRCEAEVKPCIGDRCEQAAK